MTPRGSSASGWGWGSGSVPGEEPRLAPPGAGLPWPRNWIVRAVGPLLSRRSDWDANAARFERLIERIAARVEKLTHEELERRVLVPRLPGLEDSSRYWSVAMTLEHLNIVTPAITEAIVELSHGRRPPVEADTAKVKPRGALSGADAAREFRAVHAAARDRLARDLGDRRTRATHRHPWFGPFTAHQWHWLLPNHLRIHERQIEAILAGATGP